MKRIAILIALLIVLAISNPSSGGTVKKIFGGNVFKPAIEVSCTETAVAYDTFTGAAADLVDHTADTGETYTMTFAVDSIRLDGSGNAVDNPASVQKDLAEMSYNFNEQVHTVQVDVTMTAGNTIVPGPAYSFRSSGTMAYAFFDGSDWNLCSANAFAMDCSTLIGTSALSPPSVGTTQTLKIIATPINNTITFSVDDTVLISGAYGSSGKPGLVMVDQTGPGQNLMDNFCAFDEAL